MLNRYRQSEAPLLASERNRSAPIRRINDSVNEPRLTRESDNDLLTIPEVAAILRVRNSWVYERTRRRTRDRIPGFRIGKYWRFRLSDIHAWVEENRHGRTPTA
jgi:excisionase family DNA binding protein